MPGLGSGLGLTVEIRGDSKDYADDLSKSETATKTFTGSIGGGALKVAAFAGAVGAATTLIGPAVGAITDMTKAAAEDAAEQSRMEQAITAAGAATGDWKAQTDAAIATAQDKAFTDTQAREALISLTTATKDTKKATALMSSAMDIARFANVDLATAADAVAKAQAGQDGALRKLMPGLAKSKTATATLAQATKLAAGQADNYANSAEGMGARGADAFSELGETVGGVFLDAMREVMPALLPILKSFAQLITALLPVLLPLLRILASVLGIVARVLGIVVGWLIKLVGWLSNAINSVGRFLDSINPLKNIKLPSLPFLSSSRSAGGAGGPAVTTRGARGARAGWGASSGPTVNIYGAIDPEGTARAVARVLGTSAIRTGRASPLLTASGHG